MILTPIEASELPLTIDRFAGHLHDEAARRVLDRLAQTGSERACDSDARRHHDQALALARAMGIPLRPGSPRLDFGWDGTALRTETEAYVFLHEIAHWQIAPPERRALPDFGLGAGPESGARECADRMAALFGIARETEEALSSLLGILWEVELGQPALASFLDQNWLEGAGRPASSAHFERVLSRLGAAGFLDGEMRPTRRIRSPADPIEWYTL